jgi:hypothetical protein
MGLKMSPDSQTTWEHKTPESNKSVGRIRDTPDRDAVAPLPVLVEGPASEDFGIIGVCQNCHMRVMPMPPLERAARVRGP